MKLHSTADTVGREHIDAPSKQSTVFTRRAKHSATIEYANGRAYELECCSFASLRWPFDSRSAEVLAYYCDKHFPNSCLQRSRVCARASDQLSLLTTQRKYGESRVRSELSARPRAHREPCQRWPVVVTARMCNFFARLAFSQCSQHKKREELERERETSERRTKSFGYLLRQRMKTERKNTCTGNPF